MEESAHQHFNNFSQYIGTKTTSSVNLQAKNKLAKLNKSQFSELAMDVNDEINRRKSNSENYLPFVNEYPLKRNQAREKLSTLNEKRFMDLAADVLGELTRRFPECQSSSPVTNHINRSDNSIGGKSSPNSVDQSNRKASLQNVAPIVISSPITPQHTVPNNYNSTKTKFHTVTVSNLQNNVDGERNKIKEYEQKMSDYQSQITDYELKNLELEAKVYKFTQLENECANIKADFDRLKISEESTKEAHKEIESKYLALEEQYNGLKEDYGNQEQMTLAIRVEANSLLEEIKSIHHEKDNLQRLNKELSEKNEAQLQKIKILEDENKRLAQRLGVPATNDSLDQGSNDSLQVFQSISRDKESEHVESPKEPTESGILLQKEDPVLTEAKASNRLSKDVPLNMPSPVVAPADQTLEEVEQSLDSQPRMPDFINDSLISRQKTFAYEEALQELFLNAEMQESTGILISMKEIVLSCKAITEELSEWENQAPNDAIFDSKADLSAALTKLMGVSKIHAAKPSAESLKSLYALASELTTVLEKLVNSLSTSSQVLVKEQDLSYLAEGYDSYYDPGVQYDDNEKLKVFLEQQTDVIVRSIQTLLNSMRQPGPYGDDFMEIVHGIVDVVDLVIGKCRPSMIESSNNPQIRDIFEELYGVSRQLESFGTEMLSPAGHSDKQLKQKMASASYDIAKFVKELLTFLES